eukprot:gene10983-19822_t
MGRTVIAEDSLKDGIDSLFGNFRWQTGLLLGQLTEQKDFIVHMARTPDPVEDEAEIESCQGDESMPLKQEEKKEKKKQVSSNAEEINEKWIIEHARQVSRMLPGGIHIIGVYLFGSPDLANKYQGKLKQCISAFQKVTERSKALRRFFAHSERMLLHICASTRKITCRTMSSTDTQMQLKPAEFKYQSFLSKWNSVKCVADIDLRFNLPVTSEKSQFESLIFQGLQDQLEDICDSVALIKDSFVEDEELLFEAQKVGKGKPIKEVSRTAEIDFFACNKCDNADKLERKCSRGVIKFVGKSYCVAYLHPKATKGEAIKALKGDIIRSILSRIQLLCEEAEVNNLYQVDDWSLVSPTRVLAQFKKTPLYFCDYVFKDEESKETLERFYDLLNLSITKDSLVYNEKSPDIEMAAQMSVESGQSSSNEDSPDQVAAESQSEKSNYLCKSKTSFRPGQALN